MRITMQNQNQFIRHTAAVLLACGLIVRLLPGFAAAQDLPAQTQTSVGDYVSHAVSGNRIHFALEGGAKVRVELCRTDLARIRMVPPGQEFIANEPYIIAKYDWPDVGGAVTDEGAYLFQFMGTAQDGRGQHPPHRAGIPGRPGDLFHRQGDFLRADPPCRLWL
jgi:hypothetical protein